MLEEGGEAPFDDNILNLEGDDIQKLSVIHTLPTLLAGDPETCIRKLMPKMQQTLPTASTEFHVAASTTFKTILEQRLVSHSTFTQTFLQSILNSLDSRDQIVAHAWLETLLDAIELLSPEVIRHEILPIAVNKGQLSQPVDSRIVCCKLVGKISTRFDSQIIKKDILPTVYSLCQDVNSDVRACICLQLRFVAEGLDSESVKSALLPSIVELASDEESIVRHASVQTVVHLLPHLQPDVIKNTITPLVKKLCDNTLKSDDTVICVIAEEFGRLMVGLDKCLSPNEKSWLLKYFHQLSQVGITPIKSAESDEDFFSNPVILERHLECRRLCAFNIPAIFSLIPLTSEYLDKLLPVFSNLATDSFFLIRKTIACGIHEVAKILGPKNYLIKNDLIKLLKDDNRDVLQGLIPHLSLTLEFLFQYQINSVEQIDSTLNDLGKALLKCENEIFNSNNWRLSKLMYEQLEILPKCFPSEYIYSNFVFNSFNRALNARPIPVKLAAGRTYLVFLRYNLNPIQRSELRDKLLSEFARNSNSYVRMLFLRMMIEATEIFSSVYFKEHFYSTILSLTEDPVPNIRLKFVTLLPTLKSYLRLPFDKELLYSYEANVRNLVNNEKDQDVIFALTNVIRKLDEIDVRHESQWQSIKLNKYDNEDMKKYEEEKKLTTAVTISSIKKTTITNTGRINDGSSMRNNKQNSGECAPKTLLSSTSKGKQAVISDNPSKMSKQSSAGGSRSLDLAKAGSMPEIPVTLLDDEFLVDTGVRIPAQLSSSQSTSKIPNLQDIIYRNTRINSTNCITRRTNNLSSSSSSFSLDKNKQKSHYFNTHENYSKQRSSIDKSKNRYSMNYEDGIDKIDRMQSKNYDDTDLKGKKYTIIRGKSRLTSFDSPSSAQKKVIDDSKSKMVIDRDKSKISHQHSGIIDKSKRHSTSYSSSVKSTAEIKENKQKLKRHSVEITDYHPNRAKKNFTLDVNHNQGSSKIPLRTPIASGSRTAPVTRASSPIRMITYPRHSEIDDEDDDDDDEYRLNRELNQSITRFSSSDEEVDKLCIRFAYVYQSPSSYYSDKYKKYSPKYQSKLPLWVPRKKS